MKRFKFSCLSIVILCVISFFIFTLGNTCKADTVDSNNISVSYSAHVQYLGWQTPVSSTNSNAFAGTAGQGLRVEGIKVNLVNAPAGADISYQAHVQNIGWMDWVSGSKVNDFAGTAGQSLRVEAIRIKLQGESMKDYSVQYCAHVQNIGWMDWVSDEQEAGTDGKSLRIEALKIRLVKKVHTTSIALNKTSETLQVGQTDNLTASFTPSDTTDKGITWTSSDNSIASVDSNGKVTANKEGTAEIKAVSNDGGQTAPCKITVTPADPKIQYSAHVQNIGWMDWVNDGYEAGTDGKSLRVEALKIKLLNAPANAKILYKAHVQNIGWQNWVDTNSDSFAGTMGQSLRVEALQLKLEGMPGYYLQYQAHVQNIGWMDWVNTVNNPDSFAGTMGKSLRVEAIRIKLCKIVPVESISISKPPNTIYLGHSETLSAVVNPSNATNQQVYWHSSNDGIVHVDLTSGIITGVNVGTATITATSEDGSKTASCPITVINVPVDSVTLNKSNTSLDINESETLSANVLPKDVLDKSVLWSSSDPSVATVDNNGTVTAIKQGTATITATSECDKKTASCYVTVSNKTAVVFKSSALEDAVRTAINKPTGTIYKEDVATIKKLDASKKLISFLDGIEYLTSLESLDLSNNENINDFSQLKNLTNLKLLCLDNTGIANIDILKNLANLQILSLDKNNITNISTLNNFTKLQELYLSKNNIKDFSVLANLTNLQALSLEGREGDSNKLQDSGMTYLSGLTNLQFLNLNNNNISDISILSNLHNLVSLNLGYNPIKNYNYLANLSNLEELSLYQTTIADLTPLIKLTFLDTLDLGGSCNIKDISNLANLTNLKILSLRNTDIVNINPLYNLTNLVTLDISGNSIKDISALSNLNNLTCIDLSGNLFSDSNPLKKLINLEYMNISATNVSSQDICSLQSALPNCQIISDYQNN